MGMKEQWIAWNPDNKLSINYEKACFLDCDKEGTIITYVNLENNNKKMKLIFKGGGLASYRYTNESFMVQVERACASEESLAYKVINSRYIRWLSEASDTLSDFMLPDLQHYVFVSSDDYIEVLFDGEPDIIFEELK